MVNWHSRRGIVWASGALGRPLEQIVSVAAGSAHARRLYEQRSVQGANPFQMHDLILLVHLGKFMVIRAIYLYGNLIHLLLFQTIESCIHFTI